METITAVKAPESDALQSRESGDPKSPTTSTAASSSSSSQPLSSKLVLKHSHQQNSTSSSSKLPDNNSSSSKHAPFFSKIVDVGCVSSSSQPSGVWVDNNYSGASFGLTPRAADARSKSLSSITSSSSSSSSSSSNNSGHLRSNAFAKVNAFNSWCLTDGHPDFTRVCKKKRPVEPNVDPSERQLTAVLSSLNAVKRRKLGAEDDNIDSTAALLKDSSDAAALILEEIKSERSSEVEFQHKLVNQIEKVVSNNNTTTSAKQ